MARPIALAGTGNLTSTMYQANTTTVVGTKPANTAVGDLLIAVPYFQNAGSGAMLTAPSGWTRLGPAYATTGDARRPSGLYALPVKDAAALSVLPSSWTFSTNMGGARAGIIIFRVTGADLNSYKDSESAWTSLAVPSPSTSQALPSLITAASETLLIGWLYTQNSANTGIPTVTGSFTTKLATTFTTTTTSQANSGLHVWVEDETAGATGNRSVTFSIAVPAAAGYVVALKSANTTPPTTPPPKTPISSQVISHRGTIDSAADTTEEQASGLTYLPSDINGVEIDARLPSDWQTTGKVFLCHDETINRTSPNGSTGTVSSMTTAQLQAAGIQDLESYLKLLEPRKMRSILVQHYTPNTVAQLTPIIKILNASPLKNNIMVMTSASAGATPGFSAIRGAGWTGRLGCYGMTASNWSTYGPQFATYTVNCGFTLPGDSNYTANRAHITTMKNAGYETGASTVNGAAIQQAIADGVTYILTDRADSFGAYELPPNNVTTTPTPAPAAPTPSWTRWNGTTTTVLRMEGMWNGTSIVPFKSNTQ